jgi:hypothetical protein
LSSLTAASAQNINFHNGWIKVINETGHKMNLYVIPNPGAHVGGHFGHAVWHGTVFSSIDLNNCCYAAGSTYLFAKSVKDNEFLRGVLDTASGDELGAVQPRLCNRNGTPYGYAEVKIYENHLVRIDTGCP